MARGVQRFEPFDVDAMRLRFPRPQTGARIPISWKRGFRGPKPPFPVALKKGWKREFSVQESPFSMCSLAEKKGFFERKLPFPERGEMGGFRTPKPSFPGNGDSGPCLGRGNRKRSGALLRRLFQGEYA